jgi:DNA invertase Pin-like site-specific DNA recombinase
MVKIYQYLRRSTHQQKYSLLIQREILNLYLGEHPNNYEIIEVVEDTSSATNVNRPEFVRIMDMCIENNCSLMVTHLDRLTRTVADFDYMIDKGLKIISLDCLSATIDDMRFKVLMSEIATKRNNKATSDVLKYIGKYKKLGNPYGWTKGQEKAQISRKTTMKNWILVGHEIYDVINRFSSPTNAAKFLNENGYKTLRNKKWQANQVNTFVRKYREHVLNKDYNN